MTDPPPEVVKLAHSLRQIVDWQCQAAGLPVPRLTVEPGRGIVGPSMVTLYSVGTIKGPTMPRPGSTEIGRASCRERV